MVSFVCSLAAAAALSSLSTSVATTAAIWDPQRYAYLRRRGLRAHGRQRMGPRTMATTGEDRGTLDRSYASLVEYGVAVLHECNPIVKKQLTHAARRRFVEHDLAVGTLAEAEDALPVVWGREDRPLIVSADAMPKPKDAKCPPALFYLHSLAHVELNAINLCWDTMVRFSAQNDMPQEYYDDFLRIADDESSYGALPAHDLICRASASTRTSLLERLAIGQLVQEARGLDAAPRVAERLSSWSDWESSRIVRQIGEEEVDHVRTGMRWYIHLCDRDDAVVDPVAKFHTIAIEHGNLGAFSPPFNEPLRSQAGLEPEWYRPVSEAFAEILTQRKEEKARRLEATT